MPDEVMSDDGILLAKRQNLYTRNSKSQAQPDLRDFVENGDIRIVATNNINLFETIKVRVSKLIERARTLPQFA